ncbi:MAG: type I restriction endonuclease [Paludibacteraceae bacterium]|nr:type I restriction endonuclease [Paludibacteraceae bacterium]
MDFKDAVLQIADRYEKNKDNIATEEATKNSLILPMIQALGYNIFEPQEVKPEYTCDAPTKNGDKVDYAIFQSGKPILLIECKHCAVNLDAHDKQLYKYFTPSKARFALLTNGVRYKFFTDLERSNIMDEKPFLDIDITDLKETDIEQLKKFHKSYFNESDILSTAELLQKTLAIKSVIEQDFVNPSEEFVRYFTKSINDGKYSAKLIEQCTPIVKKAILAYINDVIQDRLTNAIEQNAEPAQEATENASDSDGIITTDEEIDAFLIVKNILRKDIDVSRITYKDFKAYFLIYIDDNRWKWICRLSLKQYSKRIAFQDGQYDWTQIESIDDIYKYSEQLSAALHKLI